MNSKLVQFFCLFASLLPLFVGCQTSSLNSVRSFDRLSDSEYQRTLNRYTKNEKNYSGFYNQFDFHITEINAETSLALLKRKSQHYQWEPEKFAQQREARIQEMASSTRYFLTFFSPDRKLNRLDTPDSIFQFFLEVNGTRYPGKIRKDSSSKAELSALYSQFSRFHKPYSLVFEVPTSEVETGNRKVIVTSSIGGAEVSFP